MTSALQVSDTLATFIAPVVANPTPYVITVEADDGKGGMISQSVTITVSPSGSAILILDKEVVNITVGGAATVTATALKADRRTDTLTALSSKGSVATVSVTGNIISL